jgi:hypothetical protein
MTNHFLKQNVKGNIMPKTIKIQPFDFDLTVFTNKKEFQDYLGSYQIDTSIVDSAIGYCCNLESETNNALLMLLPKKYNNYVTIHESVHLSWFILEIAHIKLKSSTQEIQAYLVEHIVKQIKEHVYSTSKSRLS